MKTGTVAYPDVRDCLHALAQSAPRDILYTFLTNGDSEAVCLTRRDTEERVRSFAAGLCRRNLMGQRVLIALDPGLNYIVSMLACLYAGAVAVPVMSPDQVSAQHRLQKIIENCEPMAAIVDIKHSAGVPALRSLKLFDPAELETGNPGAYQPGISSPTDLAFLQYTSGSTGAPKGVRVTRGNLSHNCFAISQLMGHTTQTGVLWLPPSHDMGLVSGILRSAFSGAHLVLLSPFHFLQRPVRWLRAITRYQAVASSAPDFAYGFCADRITESECESLDLQSWQFAFCGAEPVRRATLGRFAEVFSPYGFRQDAFKPCYGLAESTLLVTAKQGYGSPSSFRTTTHSLRRNKAEPAMPDDPGRITLVGCGMPVAGTDVRIVDPSTREELPERSVGEIWVAGESVADGYWQHPASSETFSVALADDVMAKPFLRTGDLGFLHKGELFPSGRIKNLILVRGRNVYAEDIERSACASHDLLTTAVIAAFPISSESREDIGIVVELSSRHMNVAEKTRYNPDLLLEAIRRSVLRSHGVLPGRISLVRRGAIPRTSSGKIQRHACAELLEQRALPVLSDWIAPEVQH